MFLSRNKANNVYPCEPQFYYIKVGFKGSKLYRYVFVMSFIIYTDSIHIQGANSAIIILLPIFKEVYSKREATAKIASYICNIYSFLHLVHIKINLTNKSDKRTKFGVLV